ncbi:HicB family protein [Atopobacter sp. AH10]|uniref:type II toxin-antitoxin system HicB family antitoxin n=1 Tax=Atopobacter sp. AH10 TaxID=2315861 RepID=UPI000EF1F226|nr:type II toxin-antitoxin system HicB family antitoxin [Atopobacter sp. AH10]RLK63166.1 HicB family protein [Atopobacter sp. AH10]
MAKYNFVALFKKSEEPESNIYTVTVPDVPGVVTEGNGIDGAIEQVKGALEEMLLTLEDMDKKINTPRSLSELKGLLESDEDFLQYIPVDTYYARLYEENTSVNKMVTLPKWMEVMAKEKKINFSQTLQEALRKQLQVESH